MKLESIINEWIETNNRLETAKKRETELVNTGNPRFLPDETITELQRLDTVITDCKLAKQLLQHNANVTVFNELLPVAIECVQKWNNKPYGEKTSAKISAAVKEKTGCDFYITRHYDFSDTEIVMAYAGNAPFIINISAGAAYNRETKARADFLPGNKLNCAAMKTLELWYEKPVFVKNIPAWIAALKETRKAAVKAKQELENACEKYNTYAIGDIERIYPRDHFTEQF